MGLALYRKYRSRSLDEIVGQSHITAMLARAIASGNVAHAYLLTGPRGVGKTSIARILAHQINDLPYDEEATHLDIIEIDAASNNSVEDIRDLRDKVMMAPTSAKKKIYIIDEVHMLSKSAFNALLKTLEEPPAHVVFILATTDAEKLPATIISRVQRFNFRTISPDDAAGHLRTIAEAEHIDISDDALQLIATYGKGSFRDSIGLLDQVRNLTDETISPELIQQVLGLADNETVAQLLAAYDSQDIAKISALITEAENRGTPAITLADQLIQAIRADIATKPHLLPLLDKLLDIARSAWPHVKLLTALAHYAPEVAIKKPEMKKKAPQPSANARNLSSEVPTPPAAPPKTSSDKETVPSKTSEENKATSKKPPKTLVSDQPFPWTDFLALIKPHSTGAFSLLSKCGYVFDGTTLTIYCGKPFTKKQIEKALPHLSAGLEHVGVSAGTITLLDTPTPPKDSAAAAVLDIMGGGEEVRL